MLSFKLNPITRSAMSKKNTIQGVIFFIMFKILFFEIIPLTWFDKFLIFESHVHQWVSLVILPPPINPKFKFSMISFISFYFSCAVSIGTYMNQKVFPEHQFLLANRLFPIPRILQLDYRCFEIRLVSYSLPPLYSAYL